MVNSKHITEKLSRCGFDVIKGWTLTDNEVIIDSLSDFIELGSKLQINHVFIESDVLTDEVIKDSYVTDELLEESGIPDEVISQVRPNVLEHNRQVDAAKEYFGQDQHIKVLFVHNGFAYCYSAWDSKLVLQSSEDVLKQIKELYEDEIKEYRKNNLMTELITQQKALRTLEQFIITHDDFRLCTNDAGRKDFALTIYELKQEFMEQHDIRYYPLLEYVTVMWNKHKDKVKK